MKSCYTLHLFRLTSYSNLTKLKIDMNTCQTLDCSSPAYCRGLCHPCYDLARKNIRSQRWKRTLSHSNREKRKLGQCSYTLSCTAPVELPHRICAKHRRLRQQNSQRFRKLHPEQVKASHHKSRYHEPYQNKLNRIHQQNSKCAACGSSNPGKRGWQTDHDHKTGKIRGEVCGPCNRILGHAQDDPLILEKLIRYVTIPRD